MTSEIKDQAVKPVTTDPAIIDERAYDFQTAHPSVDEMLSRVGKANCQFQLIEMCNDSNRELDPGDEINLEKPGIRFLTAQREIVTIFIGDDVTKTVKRGPYTVAAILDLVGLTVDGYTLYQEQPGKPPMPVPENATLDIHGCERFATQVKSGASS